MIEHPAPPVPTSAVDGPRVCVMCDGTGKHYTSAGAPVPGTPWTDGKRTVPTGRKCPACNGHGIEPGVMA